MSRKETDYSAMRYITEWVRPHGERKSYLAPMTPEAANVHDTAVAAGYTYSIEWIGNAYAFFISHDECEIDVVTDLIKGETSAEQRGQLSRAIVRNPVDVLDRKKRETLDLLAGSDGEPL
jgi:hypothetical protein